MATPRNPYSPPKASLHAPSSGGQFGPPMYSAWQVGVGTLFGGALAATYCLRENFLARDQRGRARIVTVLGIVAWPLSIGAILLIHGRLHFPAVSVAEAVLAFALVDYLQLSRADTPGASLHDNGRVAVVALLGMGLTALTIVVAFMVILAVAAP
jgi:hypothetical protein